MLVKLFYCVSFCVFINSNTPSRVNGLTITDGVNGLIDQALTVIWKQYGPTIDPLSIPDHEIKLDKYFLSFGGKLTLRDGKIYGLSTLTRKGDCSLDMASKSIVVKLGMGTDQKLRATYRSQYELFGLKSFDIPTETEVEDVQTNVSISFNPLGGALSLDHFSIDELKGVRVRYENTSLLQPYTDTLADAYVTTFNSQIRSALSIVVGETMKEAVSDFSIPANLLSMIAAGAVGGG